MIGKKRTGEGMRGYSISLGDVESMCRRMSAEVDDIGEHAETLRHSEVAPSDFGAGQHVGELYRAVTQGLLADSLHGARQASARLSGLLTDTFRGYERLDGDGRATFHD